MPIWRRRGGGAVVAAEGGASLPDDGAAVRPQALSAGPRRPLPSPSPPPPPCSPRPASRTPAPRACLCRGPWRRSWRRRRRSGPRTDSCGEPARWRWVSPPGAARPAGPPRPPRPLPGPGGGRGHRWRRGERVPARPVRRGWGGGVTVAPRPVRCPRPRRIAGGRPESPGPPAAGMPAGAPAELGTLGWGESSVSNTRRANTKRKTPNISFY